MTEPAVTPAAPVEPVTPAAPVASVVPAPAALAAAVAPEPVPAVAPVVTAPAAAPTSLVDGVSAVAPAAPAAPVASAAPDAKWYLSEGVPGTGETPDWFKADKYKSVDEQAKAYGELEKRFGAFTGAPKDGVYKINMPDGFTGEFDTEHNLFQELNKWAGESQLSQVAYDSVISMFARYEASLIPDMAEIKKELGDNADARLSSVMQWAKSNLSEDQYKIFRNAQTQTNAADVFKIVEAVIGKTRQVALPKPGDDVTGAVPTGLEEINAMQAALVTEGDDKGKRKYLVDQDYREMVEKKRFAYFASAKQ